MGREETLTVNGVDLAVLGLDDDGKVVSISYLGDYHGENIAEYLEAAGYEIAVTP